MDNLCQRVQEPKSELADCPWKECKDLGQYIRCYIELFPLCPKYITHKNYLKTVREMQHEKPKTRKKIILNETN